MMKQQPDKLFFDKLNTFSKDAPPTAWNDIEQGLNRGKKKFLWLSVAASVSAVALAGFLFFQGNVATTDTIADSKPVSKSKPAEALSNGVVAESTDKTNMPEIKTTHIAATEKRVEKKRPSKEQASQVTLAAPSVAITDLTDAETLEGSPKVDEPVIAAYSEPTQLAFQASEEKDNITIVLTADETKNYLTIKNKTVHATSEEKKSSTLKKLLKKAADLKVNQDPFGELRQRKNEILALNFKSDKQRGQKK